MDRLANGLKMGFWNFKIRKMINRKRWAICLNTFSRYIAIPTIARLNRLPHIPTKSTKKFVRICKKTIASIVP